MNFAESRSASGDEATLAQFRTEVARVRICDDLPRVVARAETPLDEQIETHLIGPRHLDHPNSKNCVACTME
jgi:hypothetical protein